jgi:predicted GNAT family N-acyltransferase
MSVLFKIVSHGSREWQEAVTLREAILRKPLGQVFSAAELAAEVEHFHIVGSKEGKVIATAVLVPQGKNLKMQRVAVLGTAQNKGIGGQMVSFCESYGTQNGFSQMQCHARDTAVPFYTAQGYLGLGSYFEEDGIPHLKMFKPLRAKGSTIH